jgi:hypothetical protein
MIFRRLARQELHEQHALETPPDRARKVTSRGQRELFDGR